MSLKSAIKNRNIDALKETVVSAIAKATDVAKREAEAKVNKLPAEPNINTVHGDVILGAIYDEDTIWQTVGGAYTEVLQDVARAVKKDTTPEQKEEIAAKIIAANPILRNLAAPSVTSDDGLL